MADNTVLNAGAGGDTIASDEIAGIKHQRVKVQHGADGSATDVSAASPLPVTAASLPLPSGAATAALQLPDSHNVTVDNAAGAAAVNVQDGGNSVTVDAPVGTPVNVQISDGTRTATVRDTGASDSLNVAIVDGAGAQITSFGGGTEVTEDAVSVADPIGGQVMARRRDALATETTTDGDVTAINSTAKGEVYVKHVDAIPVTDNAGSLTVDGTVTANAGTGDFLSVAAHTINEAFKEANAIGGQLDDVATTAATENNIAPARITAQRAIHTNLRNDGGTEVGTAGAPIRMDPTGSTTQPVSGTVTANAGTGDFLSIVGHTTNEALKESASIGGQLDDAATTAATEDNVASVRITAQRAFHANLRNVGGTEVGTSGAPVRTDPTGTTAQPVTDNAGSLTVDAPIGTPVNVQIGNASLAAGVIDETGASAVDALAIGGGTAHDAVDSGNPLKLGAKAASTIKAATLVAAADRVNLVADIDGVLITREGAPGADIISERVSNTDGTSTALSTFGNVASTRNYVTTIVVHNAHATTNGYVDIRDGTAGAVLMTIPLPANGGAVVPMPVPLRQPTVATALAFDVSAAITTVYLTFIGYQSKV